jgi:hypothetical protein
MALSAPVTPIITPAKIIQPLVRDSTMAVVDDSGMADEREISLKFSSSSCLSLTHRALPTRAPTSLWLVRRHLLRSFLEASSDSDQAPAPLV